MTFEKITIECRRQQKSEFEGREVARTSDSKYIVYETPKGHWVIVEKEFIVKPKNSSNRNTPKESVLSGLDSDFKIIKDKNQKALFDYIGFNKHLDQICASLGINPANQLDL